MRNVTRVLIVEDHPAVADAMTQLISEQKDMSVVGTAGSVAESISLARDLAPDVVLMDYQLPDGTGDRACSSIKEEQPAARLIFVTRDDSFEARRAAALAGAVDFIHKSQVAAHLIGAIRRAARAA